MRSTPLENRRARAGKVLLPRLRGDHRTARAFASDPARLRRAGPARHGAGRQVPFASTAEPAERRLCPRGRRDRFPTLGDRLGACVVALDPIIRALKAHVLRGERIHADDTTVPVLAKLKTITGRLSPMSATTGPSAARIRPRLSSSIRVAAPANIHKAISPSTSGSCRRTPLRVTTPYIKHGASPDPSSRLLAGAMAAESFLIWPSSPRRRSRLRPWAA